MITITSLTHPAMIAKIRQALKDAAMGKGHLHGGHANRVYVQNRKGHNILRIDYKGAANGGFVAYGGADWGQTVVTDIVKAALCRAGTEFKPTHTPIVKGKKVVGYKARLFAKLFTFGLVGATLTACEPKQYIQDNAIYERVLLECLQIGNSSLCDGYARTAAAIEVVKDSNGRLVRALKD